MRRGVAEGQERVRIEGGSDKKRRRAGCVAHPALDIMNQCCPENR